MKIPKILRRLASLMKLSVDQAGSPEGENAERMMTKMRDAHPINLDDDALELHEESVTLIHDWENDLVFLLSRITNVEVSSGKNGTVRFTGIRVAVQETVKQYEEHRVMMERLSGFTVLGYMTGAFPKEEVMDYITDIHEKKSKTVQSGQAHAEEQKKKPGAFDKQMTAAEGELMGTAHELGAASPAEFWTDLTPEEA